ncbi:hypothetical protein L6Q96_08905 [Candidatus Binatia bacterium]|nr:hypothetical protein [Candidatus Binatia bacterium]
MTKSSVGSFALAIAVALLGAAPTVAQVADCTGQPSGVPCTDTDNNPCTSAACDGAGTCDQSG